MKRYHIMCAAISLLMFATLGMGTSRADIFQWDFVNPSDPSEGKRQSGRVCHDGAGVVAAPGVDLSGRNLTRAYLLEANLSYASLYRATLTGAYLRQANLTNASCWSSTLTNADLSQANLSNAYFDSATLTNADLTDAVVVGADLRFTTSRGFTKEQLYSTASYKNHDLSGISLSDNVLSGWNFAGQNLTNAALSGATLTSADLTQANLSNAYLSESTRLTNANLTDAAIVGAQFVNTTLSGFTKEQLYSTASYKNQDLSGIGLGYNDLTGWNFAGQNLTSASFSCSTLINADLSQANVTNVYFDATTSRGFTKEQLYSTASYRNLDLSGIVLYVNDLTGWNFAGQNLTEASFDGATLTNADLTDAVVAGASFGAFWGDQENGLTKEQLYSTASYKNHDLSGVGFYSMDLTGWNFAGQDLTNAYFSQYSNDGDQSQANLTNESFWSSTLTDADLTDTVVAGAFFGGATSSGFAKEQLYSTASYKNHDLSRIFLGGNDLTGWNFVNQNLTEASFDGATLTNADMTDAVVVGASFVVATSSGFTKEHLYSTASYKNHDLTGIRLESNDLTGWNFAGQNLTNADFSYSVLIDADLTDATIARADFGNTTEYGLTKEQLYSTASYKNHDLSGIRLYQDDLTGWNFAGQNLTNVNFCFTGWSRVSSTLTDADLRGTDMRGAYLDWSTAIIGNTILPDGHIPGLELEAGQTLVVRDYDGNPAPQPYYPWGISIPPIPPLPIHVEDHFIMGPGGVLQMLFEGDAWDSTISFEVGIRVMLGGTLELQLAAGVVPSSQIGRTFDLFDWTGVAPVGEFNIVSPYIWDASRLYSAGEITLVGVPEASSLMLLALGFSHLFLRRRR